MESIAQAHTSTWIRNGSIGREDVCLSQPLSLSLAWKHRTTTKEVHLCV